MLDGAGSPAEFSHLTVLGGVKTVACFMNHEDGSHFCPPAKRRVKEQKQRVVSKNDASKSDASKNDAAKNDAAKNDAREDVPEEPGVQQEQSWPRKVHLQSSHSQQFWGGSKRLHAS